MTQEDFWIRFLSSLRTHRPTKCWKWKLEQGRHTRVSVDGKSVLVRRAIYQFVQQRDHPLAGPLEPGKPLVNTCGNPRCLNPHHLAPAQSARAIAAEGRSDAEATDPRGAQNRQRTHCPSGHPYDEENTYDDPSGRRRCRACNRIRNSWRGQARRLMKLLQKPLHRAERRQKDRDPILEPTFEELHDPPETDWDGSDDPKSDVAAML